MIFSDNFAVYTSSVFILLLNTNVTCAEAIDFCWLEKQRFFFNTYSENKNIGFRDCFWFCCKSSVESKRKFTPTSVLTEKSTDTAIEISGRLRKGAEFGNLA